MRDKGDGTDLSPGDGLYYHVMMMMNTQNRTTEAVPPARIYKELKRYVDRGATKYAIINVSGIRPAAMSVQAMNNFLWNAEPYLNKDPEVAMKEYMQQWYAKQFSPELAADLTALRLHYYQIPYMREAMPEPHRWRGARGEHLMFTQTEELLKRYQNGIEAGEDISEMDQFSEIMKQAKGPLVETKEFFPDLWKKTLELEKRIPADRKNFYQAHFTYQVAVHMYGSQMLDFTAQAVDQYANDRDPEAFANNLKPAVAEVEKVIAQAHKAEYGKWDTMFMHVRLMDMFRTRLKLKEAIAKIEGEPYTKRYRGFMNGSFWGSAQDYMNNAEGVYPYFYKHSGRGLEVLENEQAKPEAMGEQKTEKQKLKIKVPMKGLPGREDNRKLEAYAT